MRLQKRQALRLLLNRRPELFPPFGSLPIASEPFLVGMHETTALAIEGLLYGLSALGDAGEEGPPRRQLPEEIRMRCGEIDQIAAATRVEELGTRIGHQAR